MPQDKELIGAWVDKELKQQAEAVAKEEQRSLSNLLVVALTSYLKQRAEGGTHLVAA